MLKTPWLQSSLACIARPNLKDIQKLARMCKQQRKHDNCGRPPCRSIDWTSMTSRVSQTKISLRASNVPARALMANVSVLHIALCCTQHSCMQIQFKLKHDFSQICASHIN